MAQLDEHLKIDRCPHCSIDNPNLQTVFQEFTTFADNGTDARLWRVYKCKRCGGVITAYAYSQSRTIEASYPSRETVNQILPDKVKTFLQQAIDSTFAPAGSVMLCASSVDAMLKEKGYLEGSLYTRINRAADEGLLTKEMATWAHQIRLESNDQRHSDVNFGLPTVEEAKQAIEFTRTLSEFLFVLPAKVTRGIATTKPEVKPSTT
jgi:hypothetical protein